MSDKIKQIKAPNGTTYEIDAKYWDGHQFSEITNLVHGVVGTYVIEAKTGSSATSDYKEIVESSAAQLTTTTAKLGALTGVPAESWVDFSVGDIILMGATSDGKVNFDRWISKVDNSGNVTLDVLETQVAKHHHTITVPSIRISDVNVLTSATVGSTTTSNMAYAGSDVNVVTGASDDNVVVVTSVTHDGSGNYNLKIETGASTDYGHSHTVNAHNHTVKYDKTTVSSNVEAFTSLNTDSYTPHTHTLVSVAGEAQSDSTITYVNATPKSTATFIKTLTDASTTTATGGATPATNDVSLTTTAQTSDDTIGDIVKTKSAGSHSHTVNTTTDSDVVTAATVAASVVISAVLSYTAPSVAAKVVTSVSYSAASTVTGWTATVDSSGILSFNAQTANRISSITVPTPSDQSAGSATLDAPRASQSRTLNKVTSTGSAVSAGAHQHGFSHTHAIASHSHTVNNHTHTYLKTVASTSESAITALSTSTYNAHKHTNISVVGTTSNSSSFTYVTGGSKTSVVRDLAISSTAATVENASPGTSTAYQKITGTITHPVLSVETNKLSNMLKTGTIKPAVDSAQKPAMTVSTGTITVVRTIDVGEESVKTSTNIGGE